MIFLLSPEVLEKEVFQEQRFVLIAFLKEAMVFPKQFAALKYISRRFESSLKVCLADEYYLNVFFIRFGFCGTPLYLLLKNGEEKSRFFGYAAPSDLEAFIAKHLDCEEGGSHRWQKSWQNPPL